MTNDIKDNLIKWRRYFHQHPEVSYQEYGTSNYIYETLKTFDGIEVKRLTDTSVTAILKGTAEGHGKTIILRADIDALPMQEETDLNFKSVNNGVMHACGHDAHPSMLLGAVQILSQEKDKLSGEIRFIFQHAEEEYPGGAHELVDKGVTEGVDYAYALHVSPEHPTGAFSIKEGAWCAAADEFYITIHGAGGHAAEPASTKDPVIVGAEFTTAIQSIVARKISPNHVPVVSVTNFHAGEVVNVIPEKVEISGTIRSHDEESRVKARTELERILKGVCLGHDVSFDIGWDLGYPAVVNHPEATDISRKIFEKIVGQDNIVEVEYASFGTEDFSSFSSVIPSSMQQIGVYSESLGNSSPLHNPKFTIDEEALALGTEYFVEIARTLVK
jgi:amidohydrolase